MSGRIAAAVVGGLGSLVLAGGVAAAVTQAHTDPPAVLPAVCRDNPGSAGGALPGGQLFDATLRQLDARGGATVAVLGNAAPALGSGSAGDLRLRAQALAGSGNGSGGGAGVISSGTGGTGGGSGDGSGRGPGHGAGAGGTGGRTGGAAGPAGGQGNSPIVGNGPDAAGVPQQPNPEVVPAPVAPTASPATAKHRAGKITGGLLLLLTIAALAVIGYLLLRRRDKPEAALPDATGMQPAQADALAEDALSQGDLDAALRWTFVSGLLRLDHTGVLPYDPTRTTLECARWVRSARFSVLAGSFDLVAYGGRHATRSDVIEARHGWDALVTDLARRADVGSDRAVRGPLVRR